MLAIMVHNNTSHRCQVVFYQQPPVLVYGDSVVNASVGMNDLRKQYNFPTYGTGEESIFADTGNRRWGEAEPLVNRQPKCLSQRVIWALYNHTEKLLYTSTLANESYAPTDALSMLGRVLW